MEVASMARSIQLSTLAAVMVAKGPLALSLPLRTYYCAGESDTSSCHQ